MDDPKKVSHKEEEPKTQPPYDYLSEEPRVWKTWQCPHQIKVRQNGTIKMEKW